MAITRTQHVTVVISIYLTEPSPVTPKQNNQQSQQQTAASNKLETADRVEAANMIRLFYQSRSRSLTFPVPWIRTLLACWVPEPSAFNRDEAPRWA